MNPDHINPLQWHQAVGFARQSCARVFRDGGAPGDAVRAFGLKEDISEVHDWGKTVEAIAEMLCAQPIKSAA